MVQPTVAAWFAVGALALALALPAKAGECPCAQHQARASGPDACSKTESKSYCTIAFGASPKTIDELNKAIQSGWLPAIAMPDALRPLTGNIPDPANRAFRLITLIGRTDVDLVKFVSNAPEVFTGALMLAFGASAIQIAPEPFLATMKEYFARDHAKDDQAIFEAFTKKGGKVALKFGSSSLRVGYRCAVLVFNEFNSVVVAGEGLEDICRTGT